MLSKLFDPISIFIYAFSIANIFMYRRAKNSIDRLNEIVHPKNDRRIGMQTKMSISADELDNLINLSDDAASKYTWFVNITAIFPLLGILGTVLALMNSSGTENLSANFSMALWTTFLGLVCAIICKLFDSGISSKLDRALDEADYLIHKHDEEKRELYAAQADAEYCH